MAKKKNSQILEHDRYVVLNDNDPDLTPIVLSLPDPPELKLIDGYGLPIEEQKFQRLIIPDGLRRIEKQAIDELTEERAKNGQKVVTLYKIQKRFWHILEQNDKKYSSEINFIKRVWWHRVNGYWFFNRGKPTYITGWHFFYLNFWTMDTEDGSGRPEYRDRDRKEFIFKHYAITATETFKRLDENGYAIANEDGSYDMTDVGRRICFGIGQSKNRRSGNTNKGLSDCTEIVMRSSRVDGMMIFSHTGDDALKHYNTKMLPAFKFFPIWIKPLTTSGNTASSIEFRSATNDYNADSLMTKITAAESSSDKAADGQKLVSVLLDESGKVTAHDVSKRWRTIKQCLAQGNGRIIHGWSYHPSTVEEMAEGGAAYRTLLQESNFYRRLPSGQTLSGLFRLFIPADEGLDGFIDPWGYSVKDKIEDYQYKLGFKETANEFLQAERDSLLKDGSPDAMRSYRQKKRQFPLKYADSWLGEAGDIGFPLEKIDQRQAELRRVDLVERGNLKWEKDVFGGNVYWESDEEFGRFERSSVPPVQVANQRIQIDGFSVFENAVVKMCRPRYSNLYVLGADPYRFRNKNQDLVSRITTGKQSRLSNGGIAVLMNKGDSDGDDDMLNWQGYRFVLSYSYRSNADDFNEDVLKAAIYFGAMVYPETNVGNIEEYFIRKGFGGYLIYDIDTKTGQRKNNAGVHNIDTSKQRLFSLTKEYLEYRCHVECHSSYLDECRKIRSMEEMTAYDKFAAHGLALMGAQSLFPSRMIQGEERTNDISDYVEMWEY